MATGRMKAQWGKALAVALAMVLVLGACGSDSEPEATNADGAAGEDGGDPNAAFCAFAEDFAALNERADQIDFFDPAALQPLLEENRELLRQGVSVAPDEVRADLELLQGDFEATFAALEAVGFDGTQLTGLPETEGTDEADANLDEFGERVCGITVGDDEPEAPSVEVDPVFVDALVQAGFGQAAAECLAGRVTFEEFAAATNAMGDDLLDDFDACGVDLNDLAGTGDGATGEEPPMGTVTELSPEGQAVLVQQLVDGGFTEEEAQCIARETFGPDGTGGDVPAGLERCGIDLNRVGG